MFLYAFNACISEYCIWELDESPSSAAQHFYRHISAAAFSLINISLQFHYAESQGRSLVESRCSPGVGENTKIHRNQINNFPVHTLTLLQIKVGRNIFKQQIYQYFCKQMFLSKTILLCRREKERHGSTNIKALLHIQHCQIVRLRTTLLFTRGRFGEQHFPTLDNF